MPWKFNLIAPRQGLFASLLIISFALHTFLLVIATTHQLNENRASQGQLMTSQLVADSLSELEPANTVSLALIANRYATNPSVASIRILDANKQVLATSGMSKTRQGEIFVRDALQNEKKVGSIEITLIQPSIGEILRTQWLAIKKAMKYPATVIVVAIVVTIILMVKVVPVFQDLFASFGADLPAFTQMVVNMSKWMQEYWFIMIIAIGAVIAAFLEAKKRSKKFRDGLDKLALKLPIFGDLVYKAIIARYSRTLATTFAAGVPLIDALESTAGATNNVIYEKAVMKIREDVATGQQLQFAMRVSNRFPSMAIQMVAIGEESGALDSMLDKVATYYENEVDNAVDGLTSMMEPLIMAILGVLVGGLVIAMYLPIFQMGSVV
ncbi:type II secretion system F family protein [Acinetobacter baumannii]